MNILIVDDHQLFSDGLELLLSAISNDDKSLDVLSATSIKEMENLVSSKKFDLILLDFHLSKFSGETLINKVIELSPGADIVVISSDNSKKAIHTAMSHGAVGYIPKSSNKKLLISALNIILAGGNYFPAFTYDSMESMVGEDNLNLTERQKTVLNLAADGLQNKQIAAELGISIGTVKTHLHHAFRELGVRNRTQAALAISK